jgi:hypothetical protein
MNIRGDLAAKELSFLNSVELDHHKRKCSLIVVVDAFYLREICSDINERNAQKQSSRWVIVEIIDGPASWPS